MKRLGLRGLIAFVICLYGVVLVAYAVQDRTGAGDRAKLIPLQSTSCSSTTTTSSTE